MKHKLLEWFSQPLMAIFTISLPLRGVWSRLYRVAQLNAQITHKEYSVQCDGPIHVSGTGNVQLGKRVRLGRATEFETTKNGEIKIGNDVRINQGCLLASHSNITIGDFSMLGEYVSVRDANHGMEAGPPMRYQTHTSKPILIGRDVWIGRGSCILPGVTIGEGAVIAANSVVNRDVPLNTIVVGAPAKVVRDRKFNKRDLSKALN